MEEDLQKIINNKDFTQTKAVIEKSVGIFRSYCESKEYVFLEVEKYNDSELSSLLRKFLHQIRWLLNILNLLSVKYLWGIVKQIKHGLFREVVKILGPSVLDVRGYFPQLPVGK